MVAVDDFLRGVQEIKSEAPTYREGGDGSDGTCDCIGLVIGAIRRAGGGWTGTHGSNYAARFAVDGLFRQVDAADLEPGWLVFKALGPMDAGYDLPDQVPGRWSWIHRRRDGLLPCGRSHRRGTAGHHPLHQRRRRGRCDGGYASGRLAVCRAVRVGDVRRGHR